MCHSPWRRAIPRATAKSLLGGRSGTAGKPTGQAREKARAVSRRDRMENLLEGGGTSLSGGGCKTQANGHPGRPPPNVLPRAPGKARVNVRCRSVNVGPGRRSRPSRRLTRAFGGVNVVNVGACTSGLREGVEDSI